MKIIDAKTLSKPYRVPSSLASRCANLEGRIATLDSYYKDRVHETYGLELRLSGAILTGAASAKQFTASDLPKVPMSNPPLPLLLFRPAFEPVVHAFWSPLSTPVQPTPLVADLASGLCGQATLVRSSFLCSETAADGSAISYARPERILDLLDRRNSRQPEQSGGALAWAFARFLDFSSIQPFPEGNGRTARALLVLDLASQLGISAPCLPLGPVFLLNAGTLQHHFRSVYLGGSRDPFFSFFLDLLDWALRAALVHRSRTA